MTTETDPRDESGPQRSDESEEMVEESSEKAGSEAEAQIMEGDDRTSGSAKPSAAKVPKKKKWKKPKDKPKRPLSAYNIYFRHERENLLYGAAPLGGYPVKIGFSDLAKTIAAKWKQLDPEGRRIFEIQADTEQHRYKTEVEEWRRIQDGGSLPAPIAGNQEAEFPASRQQKAQLEGIIAVNAAETSVPHEALDRQQSHDALVNQLVIADLMEKCNQSNMNATGMMRMGHGGASNMQCMGQHFGDPNLLDTQTQFALNHLLGGGESISELDNFWSTNAPRRMSMPTSVAQFAHLQQRFHEEQVAVADFVGGAGGRRLSMPIGIIDNTHNTALAADRRMMGYALQESHQQHGAQGQEQLHLNQSLPFVQQSDASFEQGHHFVKDVRLHPDTNLSNGLMVCFNNDSIIPFNEVFSAASGRRMSMPLSVEQQLLDKTYSSGVGSNIVPHSRSMSMPMGMSMPNHQQNGFFMPSSLEQQGRLVSEMTNSSMPTELNMSAQQQHSLDALSEMIKDDGDLFDW